MHTGNKWRSLRSLQMNESTGSELDAYLWLLLLLASGGLLRALWLLGGRLLLDDCSSERGEEERERENQISGQFDWRKWNQNKSK